MLNEVGDKSLQTGERACLDGSLELPAKVVQERLGHSSIMMTMDVYGHLFPRVDDSEELAEAERSLLA